MFWKRSGWLVSWAFKKNSKVNLVYMTFFTLYQYVLCKRNSFMSDKIFAIFFQYFFLFAFLFFSYSYILLQKILPCFLSSRTNPWSRKLQTKNYRRGLLSYTWREYRCLFFMSKKVFLSSHINSLHVSL